MKIRLTNRKVLMGILVIIPILLFMSWGILRLVFGGFGAVPKDCDLFDDAHFVSGYIENSISGLAILSAQVTIRVVQEEEGFCSPNGAYIAQEIHMETDEWGFFTTYPEMILPPANGHTEIIVAAVGCETYDISIPTLYSFQHTTDEFPLPERGNVISLDCADSSESATNGSQ